VSNLKFKKNDLFIEKVSVKKLSKKFETPFYCYSSSGIIEKFKEFEKPFKYSNAIICYAVKANPNIAILKILSKLGAGAEVVSIGELRRCLKANIPTNKIVFSGVGKSLKEIEFAIKKNILQINIESEEELKFIENIAKKFKKKIQVGIRINPDIDARTHKKITTGTEENKFGLNIKTAEKIFTDYKFNPNLDIVGLSVHIGSQIMSLNPFKKVFLKIKSLVKSVNKNRKTIKILDLGGGIGINYKNEKVLNFNDYAKMILNLSNDLGCKLILEPGRMLVGESGVLITKVLYTKKNKKNTFVVVDAGMNDLLRPALYDSYHDIEPLAKKKGKKIKYTIVGPICETADTFVKDKLLSKINTNELLCLKNVGAYGSSMSSSYNSRPIIMELIIYKNNFSVIRRTDTVINQISREKIPSLLSKIK